MKFLSSPKEYSYPYNLIHDLSVIYDSNTYTHVLGCNNIFKNDSYLLIKWLYDMLPQLSDREQYVLYQRYKNNKTYKEIGIENKYYEKDWSSSYVRQLIMHAFNKLLHRHRLIILKKYCEYNKYSQYFLNINIIDSEDIRMSLLKISTKSILNTKLNELFMFEMGKILSKNNINTIGDLYNKSNDDLLSIDGIYEYHLYAINNKLKQLIIGHKISI